MAGHRGMKRGQNVKATHGIRATYARGVCRKGREDGCPCNPTTGLSCREAWAAAMYARVQRARERNGSPVS
jgi:hypothetical protein